MNLRPWPPKRIIVLAALILALFVASCLALLGMQPWLGARFVAAADGGLRIAEVDGPAREAGLAPGRAIALLGADGRRIPLSAGDVIEEPDFHHDYAGYNAFLENQGRLSDLLASERVGIETETGVTWVEPGSRPIKDLPAIFWFQIACGGIAWLVGAGVIANGSGRATRYYALTGAAFMLVTYTAAVYSARELALDAGLFRALSVADHAGAFLFAAAFLGLLWIYPARLGDARAPRIFLAAYLAVWIADTQQWVPNMNFGIRYPMLVGLGTSFVLAAMQWRRARHEPMSRAALKWFLMTLTVGSAVFVVGVFGMQAMGHLPAIPQGFAFGFVLMMYLGMAVGMRRYRLFNLEPWWPRLWLWFLGGAMVLVIDLLLLRALVLDAEIALILTVAIAGWLYFPLRQHVLRRTLRAHDARLSALMPELIRAASSPLGHDALGDAWHHLLARAFRPISIHDGPECGADARILDDGLRLAVPRIAGGGDLVLSHADDGRALFLATDRNLAQNLLELMRQAVSRKDSHARGVREERERIARDLHDDVGAKLLTLIHKTEASDTAEHLRAVLQDLRSLAASLEREPAPLGDALGDWRGEAADRCECAGVDLDWQDAVMDTRLPIHSGCRLAVERTLREAVTNALKHARPSRLAILAEDTGDEIILSVTDDGRSPAPETWRGGLGLRNQRARMAALGGSMRYHAVAPVGSRVEIRLPKTALETP